MLVSTDTISGKTVVWVTRRTSPADGYCWERLSGLSSNSTGRGSDTSNWDLDAAQATVSSIAQEEPEPMFEPLPVGWWPAVLPMHQAATPRRQRRRRAKEPGLGIRNFRRSVAA